jgi:DNA repair protein SbcD/Mre11
MHLAAPAGGDNGALVQPGRLYLATGPSLLRLGDRQTGGQVQFVMMPFPTPARYLLDGVAQKYQSLDEKNRHLMAAFTDKLHALRRDPNFDSGLPAVLGAHVSVTGSTLDRLFRLSEQEDLVLTDADALAGFAYVALGHIHKPQYLNGQTTVRYSGSIERMDLGEKDDDKGVVVFDLGPAGIIGEPRVLPLEATNVHEITIHVPRVELPAYRDRYANSKRDLVRIHCTYAAGVDNREDVLRQLEDIFPRWYDRTITEANELSEPFGKDGPPVPRSFEDTVREYLIQELTNHPEDVRDAVLARAELLMRGMQE